MVVPINALKKKMTWQKVLFGGALPVILAVSACVPTSATPTAAPSAATAAPAASSPAPASSPAAAAPTAMAPSPMASPMASPMVMASPSAMAGMAMMDHTSIKSGADLRTVLDNLLQEHVYLAASATGAALGGRNDEFTVAAATLDKNSVELSKVIGAAYGAPAETAFLELWRKHIGMFVDYTQGVAAKDEAKKSKAVADLNGYRADFDAFITGANPNLPKGAVAELLTPHTRTLTDAIDAQAAKDPKKAYASLKMAADHMHMIGDPLAAAVAKQFPDKFPNPAAMSKAADLQAPLNQLLSEHVYLAHGATGAALRGEMDEFNAAAATLDENSVQLSKAIGSVYGAPAEQAFLPLWRAHIGFFVDYTQGAAANDQAKKAKAVSDLEGYGRDFDAFITGANPNLPKGAVAELLKPHVAGLAGMVDVQNSKDYAKEYTALKDASNHMRGIGDPLSAAIAKQFPDKFPTS